MLKNILMSVALLAPLMLGSVSFAGDGATHKGCSLKCCCGDKCVCVECKCDAACTAACKADPAKKCAACTPVKTAK